MKKINKCILVVCFFCLIFSTRIYQREVIQNTYQSIRYRHEHLIMDVKIDNDSLIGSHMFVAYGGNRIDWCEDETITIIALKKESNKFEGFIRNCYDEEEEYLKIQIKYYKDSLILYFLDPHPFLGNETVCFNKE